MSFPEDSKKEFDPELHAASIACKCNMSRPCTTCTAAWHQAWDVAEGKLSRPDMRPENGQEK